MQTTSEQKAIDSLTNRATVLWGNERAKQIESNIKLTANHIARLSADLPSQKEEPGFYF